MKRLLLLTVVVIVSVLTFSSCSKYEEGPAISFRTKAARVANEWVVDKAYDNGVEVNVSLYNGYILKLEKDGSGTITYPLIGTSDIQWEFNDSKEKIRTRSKDILGNWNEWKDDDFVTIIKLKNDEFWTKDKDNDEIHYKTK